ncbi:MAG TPA: RsmF rRNA methyltransferase first C-terminal domain-containing protein [Candidatus Lachnoclostridium pullistercoris]|uniref:RsmF rRNA methyltransferase first C-terminal domain-containing protein n=1 Tax=Candidatus Lachnoclostridium pullistercoris TaxID=2838632 RepID=A0A9D2PDH4_9FIRM|nr:RsmF rRNA methyltransferase first C-terminal domain-containing protein [Candidatus Lachnoclostridium pullistercoris]
MTELPAAFKERMRRLLGEEEYGRFMESYGAERAQGLRLNRLKAEREEFLRQFSHWNLEQIPWTEDGFYYSGEVRPGKSPFHEAGAYYIQEPSAMAVVSLLDPQPGERVLDLCAAPGGKTSHAASLLGGTGLLVSNEIHPARARILSQNVERMGCRETAVTNASPAALLPWFPEFFDRIIVDAPCSGEGMFRKDEEARLQWSLENVKLCVERQQEILESAARMLRPGGKLVYSTCTFAPEEDEETITRFLDRHGEFSVVRDRTLPGLSAGRPEWTESGREDLAFTHRIWPHLAEGEGHYLALLEKEGGAWESGEPESGNRKSGRKKGTAYPAYVKDKALLREVRELLKEVCPGAEWLQDREEWFLFGDQLYLLPEELPDFSGLKVVRPGLHVAAVCRNRLEPAHSLAAALKEREAARVCRLSEEEAGKFIGGEALSRSGEKGWTLVTAEGYSLGWGKQAGGMLKNHYPKGLRRPL